MIDVKELLIKMLAELKNLNTNKADKSATVSTVVYDSTNKKITKTINGTTTDVMTKANFIDLIYPVGSIYMSVKNTSPATLFGGTWVQLKDKYILAAGDTYTPSNTSNSAATTGGAASVSYTPAGSNAAVTLTAAQSGVPKHSHTYTRPTVSSSGKVAGGITGGSHGHNVKVNQNVASGTNRYTVSIASGYSESSSYVVSSTHKHDLPNHTHTLTGGGVADNTAANASASHNHTFTGTAATINTMSPYMLIYVWKRTA